MDLMLVCLFERKWLDEGFMKGFFCAFVGMALKVGNEWKEHSWWIKVDATQKPVLWITSYTVVEGRYWYAVGKSFGEISTISPSGSDDVLIIVSAEETSPSKIQLQKRLLFAYTENLFGGRNSYQEATVFTGTLVDNATRGKISKGDHCGEV
jgi:hypothetical protein